jgi:hypothetical protein
MANAGLILYDFVRYMIHMHIWQTYWVETPLKLHQLESWLWPHLAVEAGGSHAGDCS